MDSILLNSNKVWISENAANGNMEAKFVICDFGVNANGVQLNRDTIENWMSSLVLQPLVGKILKQGVGQAEDFGGHRMRQVVVKDDSGNLVKKVTFDTDALGVFKDVSIQTIDDTECIVATAEIWDRYPRAVQLIKDRIANGTLHTSWEISVNDYSLVDGVKIINNGIFTALAMLGAKVAPAYESSRLLEVAEADVDDELVSAITEDLKEKDMGQNTETTEEVVITEPVVSEADVECEPAVVEQPAESEVSEAVEHEEDAVAEAQETEEEVESASLTSCDLRDKIRRAVCEKMNRWAYISFWFPEENIVWCEYEGRESELDYMLFSYTVADGDVVAVDDGMPVKLTVSVAEINDLLAQKDAAIAASATRISELEAQVSELEGYKTKYEAVEAEKEEQKLEAQRSALREYALKSGYITESELKNGKAAKMVKDLDEAGIKQLIADRYMATLTASANEPKQVEISEAVERPESHSVNLAVDDVAPIKVNAVKAYYQR